MKRYFILFVFVFLLVGCQNIDVDQRTELLYAHTMFMKDLPEEEISQLDLDLSLITGLESSTPEKLDALEASYGLELSGSDTKRILILEDKMNEVMEQWINL